MPIGIFKFVREVSSEDSVHVALNLLQENAAKKWKTKAVGEKSAYVILEFEEPLRITGIDIGNEHSAFVEVLVSKSGCQVDDFKEMLLSSSFMTPIESKNSSNFNRVRCFNGEALNVTALPEKWKLVKIVCTQPFNKHVAYGLSFIKVHVATSVTTAAKPKSLVPEKFKLTSRINNALSTLGSVKLREDSPVDSESDGRASLSLFQRWQVTRNDNDNKPALSTAAAIRDAGSPAALRRLSNARLAPSTLQAPASALSLAASQQSDTKPLDRNRDSLLFGNDNPDENSENGVQLDAPHDAKKQRLSKHIEADKSRRRIELEKELEKKNTKCKRHSIDKTLSPASVKQSPKPTSVRPQKRLSSSKDDTDIPAKKAKTIVEQNLKYVPFDQLLKGVVLVISGIQNPDRAELRSKALALGAKYKADWVPGCTHLICAFRNTPKYNQVRGKGKIVTRNWIEKCYALKKYLPWRRYALDTVEFDQPESDEELHDNSHKSIKNDDNRDVEHVSGIPEIKDVDELDDNLKESMRQGHLSDPDTEDELERVAQKKQLKDKNCFSDSNKPKETKSKDIYEISTDEEDYLQQKKTEL